MCFTHTIGECVSHKETRAQELLASGERSQHRLAPQLCCTFFLPFQHFPNHSSGARLQLTPSASTLCPPTPRHHSPFSAVHFLLAVRPCPIMCSLPDTAQDRPPPGLLAFSLLSRCCSSPWCLLLSVTCGILLPCPGIEPVLLQCKLSLNH